MHSSRMRTVRSSGRISGEGCVFARRDVPGPVGGVPGPMGGECTWSGGVYLVWGGCTCPGGVPGLGGVPAWGVYLVRYSPPCGQTHACKNITFATSLRTVKIAQISLKIFFGEIFYLVRSFMPSVLLSDELMCFGDTLCQSKVLANVFQVEIDILNR